MLNTLSITLMVAYPLVAHIAIWLEHALFIIAYIIFIFFLIAIDKCRTQHWYSGLILLIFAATMSYFLVQGNVQFLLYIPSILILLSLFVLFSHSLLANQTPLITRYALMISDKDKLDDRHFQYSRSVTIVWSVFFLLMAITSITLAIFFSIEIWSLFSNVISYILMSTLFILEFFYRRHHLSNIASVENSFFEFVGKVIKIRPNDMKQKK